MRFAGSRTYVYEDVPESLYEDFMEAGSKGGFHNAMIRGAFAYRRL